MKLQPMKFRDFVWPHNPETLNISRRRSLKEWRLPFSGSVLQDCGAEKRVVEGEGRFYGPGCIRRFQKLSELLEDGKNGVLTLPEIPPFSARFVSLGMIGTAEPDSIGYRFVFWEDGKAAGTKEAAQGQVYRAAAGESLWRVAHRFSSSVDELVALNPQIRWPNLLEEGERVILP